MKQQETTSSQKKKKKKKNRRHDSSLVSEESLQSSHPIQVKYTKKITSVTADVSITETPSQK
jgi:hypothetical protein